MKRLLLGLCLMSVSLVSVCAEVTVSNQSVKGEVVMRPAPINDEGPGDGGPTSPDKPKPKPKPTGNETPQK